MFFLNPPRAKATGYMGQGVDSFLSAVICFSQETQAEMGPRQLHSEPISYTTLKLTKVVGFSAGSTMMGNFGQGSSFSSDRGGELELE